MPPPDILIQALLQQVQSTGSKSTIIQPMIWLAGILTSALVLAGAYGLPYWILVLLAILWGISVSVFLIIFLIFAFRNPDLLRSERFTLSKMAIEKNLIGDNITGLTAMEEFQEPKALSAPAAKEVIE